MKIHVEVSNVADARRMQVLLQSYIQSANLPAAAMAVRERLAGPQIHPLKPAPNHSGNGKRPGWTPERRAKFKAAIAKRKRKAKARA